MKAHATITAAPSSWTERNQRWLTRRIAGLRARLASLASAAASASTVADASTSAMAAGGSTSRDDDHDVDGEFTPALERCAELFGLSRFERDVLLLCAGVALDGGLARAVAEATGHAGGAPTFSLAMAILDDPHWDALSPQAPLRAWRLIAIDGPLIPQAPLRIDERMMHYLTGVPALDERLDGIVEPIPAPAAAASRDDASAWVSQVIAAFARGARGVQLAQHGTPPSREQVLQVLSATGRAALWVTGLPDDAGALAPLLRLIDREATLASALVVLDLRDAGDGGDRRGATLLARAVPLIRTPFLVVGGPDGAIVDALDERLHRIVLPERSAAAQIDLLTERARECGSPLPIQVLRDGVTEACGQFPRAPAHALDDAARAIAEAGDDSDAAARRAWNALRAGSRGGLDAFALRIDSETRLDDLVLPNAQRHLLRDIGRQLRHRRRVYGEWGFGGRGARGLGLAALFTGESGTGKTMAAEAIANAAGLDLYRVDLASTVSKYIGETEKNLKRIFDAAEASGAVLLFDEADALFGRRSEVKDSHDRYANIETAYLLLRIEAYRGLAVLTTNMKGSLDRAFLRRLRFIVQFPFPDEGAREELWRRQFPPRAPLHSDIRWDALARLHFTGGHIRSVALNAAFMAAHEGGSITHAHLMAAAHAELVKLERNPASQMGGRA